MLAALPVLGDGVHRLGDRTAGLVALFGLPRPNGSVRPHRAVAEQRWAALRLASAASDLLGPEQLEQVLDLRAPAGVDPFPHGAASTVADHLARVLGGYRKPRRLALVISLWDHVCALQEERQRVVRLDRSQVRADRVDRLRERHRAHYDDAIVQRLTWENGDRPLTLATAARWQPPYWWTSQELRRLLHDAIAATALLRFARTLSDEGLAVAAERHRAELVSADACLSEEARSAASRRPEGGYSHPARPGVHVHRLVRALDRAGTAKAEARITEMAAMARNYGTVVFDAVDAALGNLDEPLRDQDTRRPWRSPHLTRWRAEVGHLRGPAGWEQPPLADAHPDGPKLPLAQRIGDEDPATAEAPHDLLWFADLADALAPFYGNRSAVVRHERPLPLLAYLSPQPEELERRRAGSVPLAAAGVAQLVMFGAQPPPRCGGWAELVAGVTAAASVAEASTGGFPIPAELSSVEGSLVAGLTVELGREPRRLAEWSGYMGNCIGESWYSDQARKGQCVLMALRDPADGRVVANLDIRRHTGGWHVYELRARFNDDVADDLEQQVKQWVERLPVPAPPAPEPLLPVPPVRVRAGRPGGRPGRLPSELLRADHRRGTGAGRRPCPPAGPTPRWPRSRPPGAPRRLRTGRGGGRVEAGGRPHRPRPLGVRRRARRDDPVAGHRDPAAHRRCGASTRRCASTTGCTPSLTAHRCRARCGRWCGDRRSPPRTPWTSWRGRSAPPWVPWWPTARWPVQSPAVRPPNWCARWRSSPPCSPQRTPFR
ncbi:hypothetical protein BBK82_06940 [Lentzea guizhouensis]|uniref:DUF4132 domain-containing protein n=1 Tax=Lentzea guizhouensis TaxID=1586287 RepID=A0A1B2HDQ8_9PSEU|nr:hypothetical protein [Lentzea guizhouensis]ANZ35859.1 hypothetical protein BBK82_06940 [Lentzea guizhouensis]